MKDPGYIIKTGVGGQTITAGSSVTIPFNFNYYGDVYNRLWVSSDGTIRLGKSGAPTPANPGALNADLSRTPGAGEAARPTTPIIAPLWDDLRATGLDLIRGRSHDFDGDGISDFGIEWSNFAYNNGSVLGAGSGDPDLITFQAVLYSDGRIQFNYADIDAPNSGSPAVSGGTGATIGIWSGAVDGIEIASGKYAPGPHSLFGSIVDLESAAAETNDSYIRLAWDTGGAAWDLGAIDGVGLPIDPNLGTVSPVLLNATRLALRDALLVSLGKQIKRREAAGEVYHADVVLAAYNLGGSALVGEGFLADPFTTGTVVTPYTQQIDVSSNAIPLASGSSAKVQDVFHTARRSATGAVGLNLSLTSLPTGAIQNGSYIVELLFAANYTTTKGLFDLIIEGKSFLHDYDITLDYNKIVKPGDVGGDLSGSQYFVSQAGLHTAVVKRFEVDVSDVGSPAGLQIFLDKSSSVEVSIAGLRILRAAPPRVKDVVIKGSSWAPGVDYSFATLVGNGQQLRPIPTQNANTIEIHFDGPVNIGQNSLTVAKTIRNTSSPTATPINSVFVASSANGVGFVYDSVNYVARWTFPAASHPTYGAFSLVDGKYAIYLDASAVTGGGQALDGDWSNQFGFSPSDPSKPTADIYGDDVGRAFVVGNGTPDAAGSHFRLNFALLAGDYNGDGIVTTTAVSGGPAVDVTVAGDRWTDGNGDGVTSANNVADLAVRNAVGNAGDFLPLRRTINPAVNNGNAFYGVDLRDDDHVDGGDLAVWKATFGMGGNGDVDGDGMTGATDFLLWQSSFGAYSAWSSQPYPGAPTAASTASLLSAPPRVMNVIISGSTSFHAPFSMDTVDGSGTQLQTVPVGGADTISIVFDQEMNIAAEHLIVVGLRTFNLPDLVEFSYDAATFTATWQFEGWALGDQYLLALSDMATSVDGNWLDGEWTNPATTTTVNSLVSEFPSGDGNAGGAFKFVITLLPGDANLNGLVDGADYLIWQQHWAQDGAFIEGDFAGDGIVGPEDYDWWQANFGINLQQLSLRADFDGDFDVDAADLNVIGTNAGMTSGATWADGDLDGDGDVDMDDLDLAFAQFGQALSVVS